MEEESKKRVFEDRKLLIDHSDVYLENDKLSEALEYSLDSLSRACYRQVINCDYKIRELRQTFSSLNVTQPASCSSDLRPHTSPFFRRLKPPPVIVRLHVRVPNQREENNSKDSEEDDDDNRSETEADSKEIPQRTVTSGVTWEARNGHGPREGASTKPDKQKMGKKQWPDCPDKEELPSTWYTSVHDPSDILLKRRASSAIPSSHSRPSSFTSSWKRRETRSKVRSGRAKSALLTSTVSTSSPTQQQSTLFCAGQHKSKMMRSRRQLMELSENGKQASPSENDAYRHRFLEAVRLERERLDLRVKLFLRSFRQGSGEESGRPEEQ